MGSYFVNLLVNYSLKSGNQLKENFLFYLFFLSLSLGVRYLLEKYLKSAVAIK